MNSLSIPKYCLVFLVICSVFLPLKYYAQDKEVFDSRGNKVPSELLTTISIKFNNTNFIDAIHEIAAKGKFHINYSSNIIPAEKKINLTINNEPAFVILQKIITGTDIDIIVIGINQVVLTQKKISSQEGVQSRITISGYVTDQETGEALIGANVYIKEMISGAATNAYGFYSVTLPPGVYFLRYSYIGYESADVFVDLSGNISKNIELKTSSFTSDTIIVVSNFENDNVQSTNVGTIKILPVALNNIPVFLGEQDILKTIQMLPGISSHREVDCGIYVRGGNADQNLLLLDEAYIYNAFHTLGFFSIFNSEAIKSINIIKGAPPAKFGGRLSSVVDMQMNEGNMKEFNGVAGLGLIFSRLNLQGPIIKDKASYLISGRRTYFDILAGAATGNDVRFYLYDLNAKVNYKIDDNDRIYISGYFGRDGFGFGDEFDMDWGNSTATIRWNHLFGNKLFLNSSFIFSNFKYETTIDNNDDNDYFNYLSEVKNINLKEDFEYFINAGNIISFGANYIHHNFLPASMGLRGDVNYKFSIGKRSADEIAAYVSHEYDFGRKIKLEYGLRGGMFSVEGENDSFNFDEIEELNVEFHKSENITYSYLEPRFSAAYILDESSSIKFGFARNYQNLHQIGNSNSGTPLDVWQPSSSNIKPQRSDQFSIGYFKNFYKPDYEFSAEAYYKDLKNQIDCKDGANIILRNFFESELVFGKGWAYGLELLLRKNSGNLSGWISYCISNSQRKFDEINGGKPFNAKNNKTHEFNFVAQYQLSPKWVISVNWVLTSGFNITIPFGRYKIDDKEIIAYSERNGYRLPAYHRLDIGISYKNDVGGVWNISFYNAYNRKNIYTVLFRNKSGSYPIEAVKLSLFGIIPSVTYTLNF